MKRQREDSDSEYVPHKKREMRLVPDQTQKTKSGIQEGLQPKIKHYASKGIDKDTLAEASLPTSDDQHELKDQRGLLTEELRWKLTRARNDIDYFLSHNLRDQRMLPALS